jgi:hypothetical protein
MLELLKIIIFTILALMAGAMVGRQGVLRGDVSAKIDAFDLAICRRRVLGDFPIQTQQGLLSVGGVADRAIEGV